MAEQTSILCEYLDQLLLLNPDLITSDAAVELKMLMDDDLLSLQGAIVAVCREQNEGKGFKEHGFLDHEIQKIKRMVYEVEDTIDSCITNPKRLNLAIEVESLRKEKVKPAIDRARNKFRNFGYIPDQKEQQPTRIKALRQDNVVGLEKEIDTLIQKLNEETNKLDVLSIVGMPGLGKTTLAWNIYRDPRIRREFKHIIWVNVSQDFNIKNVLLTILRNFTPQDHMYSSTIDVLTQMVREFLKKVNFLIFMDDVWTDDTWDEIKKFLPESNTTGKVLMTTRDVSVANHASPRPPHELKFLSPGESEKLLRIELNGTLDINKKVILREFEKIAKKCDGLPLAIEVIGALLVDKLYSTTDLDTMSTIWKTVSRDVSGYLFHEDPRKNLENSISTSYKQLPYELRDCFLYLGMFSEHMEISASNQDIPASKLIRLWIAEGFIHGSLLEIDDLEGVAKGFLKELINKNLVRVIKKKFNGQVKTCVLHNTVRNFCQTIAGSEGQNLFEEITKSNDGNFKPSYDIIQKCRRLSVHSDIRYFFSKKLKVPGIRSFLSEYKWFSDSELIEASHGIDKFELLRVFDANARFRHFPTKLTELIHLRYISISCDEIEILPKDISKLWNLQTLTVDTNSNTFKVEADITKMMHLRHFVTNASIILSKDLKGRYCEKLRTITGLSPQSCTKDFLKKASNLKKLGIRGELATLLDSKRLKILERLEKLKLINHVYPKVASKNPLHPKSPLRFPLYIRCLTLSNTYLPWKHMSEVGELSSLKLLKLRDNAFVGDSWEASAGSFPQLEFLYIADTNLKFWTTSNDSFPNLRRLALIHCEQLKKVPLELGMNLEYLSLDYVTKSAADSAKIIKAKVEAKKGGLELSISRILLGF